jgi:CheY-like chemotaxis protein
MTTRVLLVEDDEMGGRFMAKALQKLGGYEVIRTLDVPEVLCLAEDAETACVVMDVSLVGTQYNGRAVDGVQITRLIKELDRTPPVPVLLATAHAMRGHADELLAQSGADAYISKPIVELQDLVDQVRQLVVKAGHP